MCPGAAVAGAAGGGVPAGGADGRQASGGGGEAAGQEAGQRGVRQVTPERQGKRCARHRGDLLFSSLVVAVGRLVSGLDLIGCLFLLLFIKHEAVKNTQPMNKRFATK